MNCDYCGRTIYGDYGQCRVCGRNFCSERCYLEHYEYYHSQSSLQCDWCKRDIQGRYMKCHQCGGVYCSQRCFTSHAREFHAHGGDLAPDEGCFITTATLNALGEYDDNCYELTLLRKFRDNYLILTPYGKNLVFLYYEIAPLIVNKLNQSNDSILYYNFIFNKFIYKYIKYIENNQYSSAIIKYNPLC